MHLNHASPDEPGWSRRRVGRGFAYRDADGKPLSDEDRERARALVIPPAWTEVWICPDPLGHLQAVGTDEAGRRQYLYHPDWREHRDAEKFERVLGFAARLPEVRRRITRDLRRPDPDRERCCALALRLVDEGCFRIGNDHYTDEHGSFGLTTLERQHVRAVADGLRFRFVGKSGVEHDVLVTDAASVREIARLRRRRGGFDQLLAHKCGVRWQRLAPDAVNDYLRQAAGLEVTVKDFRTWHATVLAARSLAGAAEVRAEAERRRAVREAMEEVADFLGNTPAVARSSYVDPRVIERYEEGHTIPVGLARSRARSARARIERAVRALLES